MKRITIGMLAACALIQLHAGELQWLTALPQAQAKAKAEHKLVILDFTGSDWCPACIRLKQEVFTKPEFVEYANKNLVPVEVDFPQRKVQPDDQKKANAALQEKYKIEGYPTVIVLDSEGKMIGQLSYEPGGPKPFISELEKLKKPNGKS